jgi:hypothetical protein
MRNYAVLVVIKAIRMVVIHHKVIESVPYHRGA